MPTTLDEWLFWVFSVLVVGFILSVVSNLSTPLIKRGGTNWLQKKRLQRKLYLDQLKEFVKQIKDHPGLLIIVTAKKVAWEFTWATLGGVLFIYPTVYETIEVFLNRLSPGLDEVGALCFRGLGFGFIGLAAFGFFRINSYLLDVWAVYEQVHQIKDFSNY